MSDRLLSFPVQTIPVEDGVIVVRGASQFVVRGPRAAETLSVVLDATKELGTSRSELLELFSETDRDAVGPLIDELVARRVLVAAVPTVSGQRPSEEDATDVFFWHFPSNDFQRADEVRSKRVDILGLNCISRRLVAALLETGLEAVAVIDVPHLRNVRVFGEPDGSSPNYPSCGFPVLGWEQWNESLDDRPIDCLVATSDFGGQHMLRQWNCLCLRKGIHFLPVLLEDMVGTIGPLVVPGETACLECARGRENANSQNAALRRAKELYAFEGQRVTGFHPSMASILGDVAAMELTKFYGWIPQRNVHNRIIEINLLDMVVSTRRLLKLPFCQACSPLRTVSSVSPRKHVVLPGNAEG